jgi:DNA-binding PadR family transcriptional regulator
MHPYEMASTMRERHKDDSIKLNYGSLYAVVESLKSHQLIADKGSGRQGNRPERTVYHLTDAGRLELIDWLSELLCRPAKEFTRYEAGLSLMPVLPPKDVIKLLEERCRRLEFEIGQQQALTAMLEGKVPRLFTVESEYRTMLKSAELEWTRKLVVEIRDGTLEGVALWQRRHDEMQPEPTSDD